MTQEQESISQELFEKLIPAARKPLNDITLAMLAPSLDMPTKAKLKMDLQKCWTQCRQRIDHRPFCEEIVEIDFAKQTHFIASTAVAEFERQKDLYNEYFTVGLKQSVDDFAQTRKAVEAKTRFDVSGWRLPSSDVCDFRRRSGERLFLVSKVIMATPEGEFKAKTSNISKGGCLLVMDADDAMNVVLMEKVTVEYVEMADKYALAERFISYQVVDIKPCGDTVKVAMKRTEEGDSSEFDLLVRTLMNEHKRRNRVDVDNTIEALSARCHNMASVAQLNALLVMSNSEDRYHILLSQGHTLALQGELLLSKYLIPQLAEQTDIGQSELFFVWATGVEDVYMASLSDIARDNSFEKLTQIWGNSVWHKAFLVKANAIDPQLADLGTSVPSSVSSSAGKLNSPLPVKIERLTRELGKLSTMEDVTYLMDPMVTVRRGGADAHKQYDRFKVKKSSGCLRYVPFNIRELPNYYGTYRFSHECSLHHNKHAFRIVNGHANYLDAEVYIPLQDHKLPKGCKVTVSWQIDGVNISLDAVVDEHDELHKRTRLQWCEKPEMIKTLFGELKRLDAFTPAFIEDVQAHRLDGALRNLVLTNLPKVAIFANAKRQSINLNALTGHQYLPGKFIDDTNKVKLDQLFTDRMLLKLASSGEHVKEILFVAVDGERILERRFMSEFLSPKLMIKVLQHLTETAELHVFAVDVCRCRKMADDDIVKIEHQYLKHYSPSKLKKLNTDLRFNMSIQLVEMSESFRLLL